MLVVRSNYAVVFVVLCFVYVLLPLFKTHSYAHVFLLETIIGI